MVLFAEVVAANNIPHPASLLHPEHRVSHHFGGVFGALIAYCEGFRDGEVENIRHTPFIGRGIGLRICLCCQSRSHKEHPPHKIHRLPNTRIPSNGVTYSEDYALSVAAGAGDPNRPLHPHPLPIPLPHAALPLPHPSVVLSRAGALLRETQVGGAGDSERSRPLSLLCGHK